jgi:hypothetical protein
VDSVQPLDVPATLLAGGVSGTLPVAGQARPFRADLGPGPDGHELAVADRVSALTDLNPTAFGNSIYWLLTSSGDDNYSELHRFNRTLSRDERVPARIPVVASGFAYDADVAYYAVPAQGSAGLAERDCPTARPCTMHRSLAQL